MVAATGSILNGRKSKLGSRNQVVISRMKLIKITKLQTQKKKIRRLGQI